MPLPAAKLALKAVPGANLLDESFDTALKGTFALAALGGTFFLVRHLFREVRDSGADKKALQQGNASYYATLIGTTLYTDSWYGNLIHASREDLYRIFREMPAEKFPDVQQAFKSRYNKSLVDELEDKLQPDEFRKILSIVHYNG